MPRGHALAVVAHPHAQLSLVDSGVSTSTRSAAHDGRHCATPRRDAKDVVANDRMQLARLAQHFHAERDGRPAWRRSRATRRTSGSRRRGPASRRWRRADPARRRGPSVIASAAWSMLSSRMLPRFAARPQLQCRLEPEQLPLDALQQGVVEVARNAQPLVHARVERQVELTRETRHAQPIERVQREQRSQRRTPARKASACHQAGAIENSSVSP